MGATGSRSTEIFMYSKPLQSPVLRNPRDVFAFRDPCFDVSVTPAVRNEETGVSDFLNVAVHHSLTTSANGTDISIEILDRTGKHTVFHRETTSKEAGGRYLELGVRRSELEASSCVKVEDDSFLFRCTVQKRPRQNWFSSKSKKQPSWMILEKEEERSEVAMSRSHTLTVDSLSKAKASLQLSCECVHSTRFAVGGSRWNLKLSPALAVVRLVRATKDDDDTVTRAEFSFELEGAVNVKSGNMTHMFDRANPESEFPYHHQPSMSSTDRLTVRCFVKVIPDAVVPTAVFPAQRHAWSLPSATAIPAEESVLTPLLSAMHR